ncbi:galactose-3-O-sulfotransferase 2-like [Liolophura sinensis]|uniref:galactose-3-O-sulfotransferase 2-like n=1 Tax=Liolophura sinensis TaxID=3198878 RepID=UPI0031595B76
MKGGILRCRIKSVSATLILWAVIAILLLMYYGSAVTKDWNSSELSYSKLDSQESQRDIREPTQARSSEVRRIVYIRIPKTGSSTMTMLVWRFAWARNLSVLAVNPKFEGTRDRLTHKMFFLPPPGQKYDVMAEHVLYNKESFSNYLAEDAVYVTMLREPFSLLYSTLYYVPAFQKTITEVNKIEAYLKNPAKYDNTAIMAGRSYTKNPQSSFLGLRRRDFDNEGKIQELISSIDRDFPVVLILERLDESLILLRRVLKWPMKDIIYSVENVNSAKPKLKITPEHREKYKKWSLADHKLYNFFKKKLEESIEEAGPELQEELAVFRKYKMDIARYCRFQTIMDEDMLFTESPYNERFSITRKDCSLIYVEPLVLISNIRKRQHAYPFLSPSL